MATLTEVAYYSRNTIKYGIMGLFGLVVLRGMLIVGIRVYKQVFPPAPPAATVKYGKLPKLEYQVQKDLPSVITYKLETPDGTTNIANRNKEMIEGQAKVYFMPQSTQNLLAIERSKKTAAGLKFSSDPELLADDIYRFRKGNPVIILDIHGPTQAFHMYMEGLLLGRLYAPPESTKTAETILLSAIPQEAKVEEITEGTRKYTFLRASVTGFSEVEALSEAEFIKVDVFRKELDGVETRTSIPGEAPIWGIVTKGSLEKGIIEMSYKYFPVLRDEFSTYPIKSSDQAWRDLGEGKGSIVRLGNNREGKVTIRRVYLGYYDNTFSVQKFMQPIYVFEGDNNFVAYVDAVMNEWIAEPQATTQQ